MLELQGLAWKRNQNWNMRQDLIPINVATVNYTNC